MDDEEVKAREWPTPKTASKVRSFHGLSSFSYRFVNNFNSTATFLNGLVVKKVKFVWIDNQERLLFN